MNNPNRGHIPPYLKGQLSTQYEKMNVVPQKAGVKNTPGVPAFASQRRIGPEHTGLPDPSTNQFRRGSRVPLGVGQTTDAWTEGLQGDVDPNEFIEHSPDLMNDFVEIHPNEMREFDPTFQQSQVRQQVRSPTQKQTKQPEVAEQKVHPGMYVVFFQNEKAVCENLEDMEGLIDALVADGVPLEMIEVYYRLNIKYGTRLG